MFSIFEILGGNEKYYLTRNLISISIYINGKKISKEVVDKEIKKEFNADVKEIKQNVLDKKRFINKIGVLEDYYLSKVDEVLKRLIQL